MMHIVRASYHQGDVRYKGRGRQCTANSVACLIRATKSSPSTWATSTLDDILDHGDKLYCSISEKMATTEYLGFFDMPATIDGMSIKVDDEMSGFLSSKISESPCFKLEDAIDQLIGDNSTNSSFLFVMGTKQPYYSCGIIKQDKCFYVFDPHSRSDTGMQTADGLACISSHKNKNELSLFLRHLAASIRFQGYVQFEISSISICSNSSESEFSGFSSESEGDIAVKLYLAQERVESISTPEISDVSLTDSDSELSVDSDYVKDVLETLNDSANFIQSFDVHEFVTAFDSSSLNTNQPPSCTNGEIKSGESCGKNILVRNGDFCSTHVQAELLRETCDLSEYHWDLSGDGGAMTVNGGELTGNVGELTGNIGKLTGNGGELSGNVGELTGNGGELTGNGGELNGNVGELTGNGGESSGNVGELTGNVGDLTGNVGELSGNVVELTGNGGELSGNVGELTGNGGELTGNDGELTGNVGDLTGNVGELTGNGCDLTGNVGELTGKGGELTGNVGELSGNVGELTGNGGELSGNVGELTGNVGELTGNVGELSGNGGQLEGKGSGLSGKSIIVTGSEDLISRTCRVSDESRVQLNDDDSEYCENDGFNLDDSTDTVSEYFPSDTDSCSSDNMPLSELRQRQNLQNHSESRPKYPNEDNLLSYNGSRKRQRNEHLWKRNIAKRRRNEGQSYTGRHGKPMKAREIKSSCGAKCKFKCNDKFTHEDREKIFHKFWQLANINKQRHFIQIHTIHSCKSTKKNNASRKKNTIKWFMPDSDAKIRVCKTFFLHTLNISDKMVRTVHQKISSIGVCADDKRGKHSNRINKVSEDIRNKVRNHIKSFETLESHYCRKDSGKLYLPSDLSITKMHHLYQQQFPAFKVSEFIYRCIFCNEFNLSFHHPKKDQCDFCKTYKNASNAEKESIQQQYNLHISNKDKAREKKELYKMRYKNMTSCDHTVCCFDLEQILMTPHSFESCLFYKRRLNSFNFTIYDLCTTEGYCYLWNETIARRGACEMASCLFNFIKNKSQNGVKNFVFFSDNCVSQNKNRFYVSMLWYCLRKFNLISFKHFYLEKGHTQNEGDSMHSSIEYASRHIPIYTTGQWATLVRSARTKKPYSVSEMTLADFIDFKELASNIKNFELTIENAKVHWNSIKTLSLSCENPNCFKYQTGYGDKKHVVDLFYRSRHTKPNPSDIELNQLRFERPTIPLAKFLDLVSLCKNNIIPRAHHPFYLFLPHD